MKVDLRFSRHASYRLFERFSLTRADLYRLMKSNKYIVIGKDKKREHWLFFSIPDQRPLVLVVNLKNKEIVTVLTAEHQGNCAVSDESISHIMKMTATY